MLRLIRQDGWRLFAVWVLAMNGCGIAMGCRKSSCWNEKGTDDGESGVTADSDRA